MVSENGASMTVDKPPASATSSSTSDKQSQKKFPKKIHKAEREKHKRDHLNDLFTDLGNMLEADRQNNGKACILSDTTRILKELLAQVDCLRKENTALLNESHYVTVEKNELEDENNKLRNEIAELQNELRMTTGYTTPWGPDTAGQAVVVSGPRNIVLPLQQPHQALVTEQVHCAPPRELQLFPEAASARENEPDLDRPSNDPDPPYQVRRPQARYVTSTESWPSLLHRSFPRTDVQQCSSGVTGGGSSSRDDSVGRSLN